MSSENLKSLIYLLVVSACLKFALCKDSVDPFKDPKFLNHDPLVKRSLNDGKINVYETTKSGLKFSFRQVSFNDDSLKNIKDTLDVKISINLNDTKQKILGFGGAFSDSACENLQKLPTEDRDNIIESYFSANGLEYTLGRTTIGGSDFSSRVYTLDDHENDYELKNFSLTYEDIDYKIPIIKMAMKHQPNLQLIATSWSPPVWLKTNKKINGRGKLIGNDVTGKSYVTYANYFVKFLDAYKKEGINIFAITPANEPNNGRVPFFPFNCIGFTASEMKDFIVKTLGPILKEAGYGKDKLKLYIADDQRIMLKYWVENIMKDPAAKEFVSGIAFHWYTNSISSPKILSDLHFKYPDLEISSTEACSGAVPFTKHVQIGNWARGEDYAKDIITDLNHWTNSWIDWNLALNDNGGPNWAKNFVDSPIIINFETKTYIRQPMFYALAHFSKFVKPGSLVLNYKVVSGESKSKDFHFSAFKTENNEVVIVVTNTYNRDVKVSITLEDDKDNVYEVLSPKKSIQTYVWKN